MRARIIKSYQIKQKPKNIETQILKLSDVIKIYYFWNDVLQTIDLQLQAEMKHMTCVNHKEAEQVCINSTCQAKCSYTCLQIPDTCRNQHEACTMASLPYLLTKSNKIIEKARSFHIQKLLILHNSAKKIIEQVSTFLDSHSIISAIKDGLDNHGFISAKNKTAISTFLNSPFNTNSSSQTTLSSLEKSLMSLNVDITTYLQILKQQKNTEEQLQNRREQKKNKSAIRSKLIEPSPVKSGLKQAPASTSKIRSKIQEVKGANKQIEISKFQSSPSNILVSSLRKHVPKPPFFSKITNDVQTISTFFYHKFSDVKLLYRASQNQFSTSKFHEKCNGYENTLTLVLTEGEKIIGGFTPLPWKSGGGQWYQDPKQMTFLFSITSGERYPLVNKNKAIWCSQAFGPSFGHPDLQIADKAAFHSNSCANFPQCFNNGNYTAGTASTQMFCGSKNGRFKIKQWEVYELIF